VRNLTFICYAHQDKEYLDTLLVHLSPYYQSSSIRYWSDKEIKPGEVWKEEIKKVLDQAQATVLLVSPHFLASDFIRESELPTLLDAAEKHGLAVLWVPVSYSSYPETRLAPHHAASDPSQPIKSMTPAEQDRIWVEICTKLKHATWSLVLHLSPSNEEVRSNQMTIQGKATFRAPFSTEESNQDLAVALKKMDVQLVPFVFGFDSGWWAQKPVEPAKGGDFQGSVYVGRENRADVGKSFEIKVCAVSRSFAAWNKSLEKLPAVRIESKSLMVKRVA
jgi:hypothetical protein